jgi:uncharacterized cupin superfamily protein
MKTIQIANLPWTERKSPTGKYHSFFKDVSIALGGVKDTGTWGGGHPFDLQIRRVPPGAAVCPLHAHTAQWELFIAFSGEATVRIGEKRQVIRAGEAFVQPPGTAHQIINTGDEDFIFHVIANNLIADSTYYPDSKKWAMKPQGKVFRMTEVDYYDGEE